MAVISLPQRVSIFFMLLLDTAFAPMTEGVTRPQDTSAFTVLVAKLFPYMSFSVVF